jgi:hypothetical protein
MYNYTQSQAHFRLLQKHLKYQESSIAIDSSETDKSKQNSQNKTVRTKQTEQNSQNKTVITKQTESNARKQKVKSSPTGTSWKIAQ